MRHLRGVLRIVAIGVAAWVTAVPAAEAHFRLLEPASALVEDGRGNPQKMVPCGGTSADAGVPSERVTAVRGGSMLPIRVEETVFHPGHYRVALAVESRDELPPDPEVTTRETERGPWSVSAVIQDPPRLPVLADGIFAHTSPVEGMLETGIALPNINCEHCTLQIIQFMAEHGRNADGDFSYHHCADLAITADPSQPIDARWPGQD